MSRNPAEDVLNELLPYFEAIDTQNAAIVQFLKDKRVVSDEQLAPYLERAAKASNVRWLAARLRMGRLFSVPETENEAAAEKSDKGQERTTQPSTEQRTQPSTDGGKPPEERERGETAEKKSEVNTNSSEDETADSLEPSERKTKSSSSEHAGSEKDAKSAPEKDSNKDAA